MLNPTRKTLSIVLLSAIVAIPVVYAFGAETANDRLPVVEVSRVRKVFDDGDHNAFTDLTVFKNAFYLTFRTCPDGHGVSPNRLRHGIEESGRTYMAPRASIQGGQARHAGSSFSRFPG